jgi:hypothetical protein
VLSNEPVEHCLSRPAGGVGGREDGHEPSRVAALVPGGCREVPSACLE